MVAAAQVVAIVAGVVVARCLALDVVVGVVVVDTGGLRLRLRYWVIITITYT
jgi:hypothetical protein